MATITKIKKILITGGSGMVGKNFLEHKDIYNFIVLYPSSDEVNLLNFDQVDSYLKANQPDLIIHAAGRVGGILANIKSPVAFLNENTDMGKNILLAAKKNQIKNLINLSSSCVYPRNINIPLEEEIILTGELEPTNEAYAIGKIHTQKLCQYINQEDNSYLYKTLIPCNLFGRYDNFNLETGHLLPNIINKINIAKQNKEQEVLIWGDGSVRREFMYTSDLIDCLFYSIYNFHNLPFVMNVGIGHDYSVLDYYKTVAEAFSWNGNFKFDLSKPVGQQQKLVSTSKLNKFGWQSKTSLKKAIKETINFFSEGNNNVI
tara:strand:+ start:203 stop:1153 length:951 start_codon:yes stop_codon:yes gene_type:complete